MGELVHELGIDWKLLIASIVNFFLLFFILRKFAYRPILGMLEKRERMIQETVQDNTKVQEEMKALEVRTTEELQKARAEASTILADAAKQSESLRAETLAQARAEAERLLTKTREIMDAERVRLLESVRGEVADLVVAATEKVLAEKLTASADHAFIERTLQTLEKSRR